MHDSLHKIAIFPIPARDENKTEPAGNNLAEQFSNPSLVILRSLESINIFIHFI